MVTSVPVNRDTQGKCVTSTMMNVPSTPVTMVEPALMESMGLNVCAERGIMTLPANHSSTNALATPVSMDTVKTKSMDITVFVTLAGVVSTVTLITMSVSPTPV